MNKHKLILKTAVVNPGKILQNHTHKAVLFHSTPVLYKRKHFPSYQGEAGKANKRKYKQFVKGFDFPFWKRVMVPSAPPDGSLAQNDYHYYNPSTSQRNSWFRPEPERSHGTFNNYWSYWNWNDQNQQKRDSSEASDSPKQAMVSERLALGLSASGPLSLDDVKNAYRSCAVKWHPDHNPGLYKGKLS